MRDFHCIDLTVLAGVVGGQTSGDAPSPDPSPSPSPNRDKLQLGFQGTLPKLGETNLGINAESDRSDYGYCASTVSRMKGATPKDVQNTCGLPPRPRR